MSLTIRQRDKHWILELKEEKWKTESREELEKLLKVVMDMKQKHGKIMENY